MNKNTDTLQKYVVRPRPYRGWAIVNSITGEVMEGGFFSRSRAQEYIWREYNNEVPFVQE